MRVLVDTSAWVEFLRATGSAVNGSVRRAVADGSAATCDAIVLEVLAGARSEQEADRLAAMLDSCLWLPQQPHDDAEIAAGVYRACRRGGETPRTLLDCLIAAVAIRHDTPVVHRDRDFDVIARHAELQVAVP